MRITQNLKQKIKNFFFPAWSEHEMIAVLTSGYWVLSWLWFTKTNPENEKEFAMLVCFFLFFTAVYVGYVYKIIKKDVRRAPDHSDSSDLDYQIKQSRLAIVCNTALGFAAFSYVAAQFSSVQINPISLSRIISLIIIIYALLSLVRYGLLMWNFVFIKHLEVAQDNTADRLGVTAAMRRLVSLYDESVSDVQITIKQACYLIAIISCLAIVAMSLISFESVQEQAFVTITIAQFLGLITYSLTSRTEAVIVS